MAPVSQERTNSPSGLSWTSHEVVHETSQGWRRPLLPKTYRVRCDGHDEHGVGVAAVGFIRVPGDRRVEGRTSVVLTKPLTTRVRTRLQSASIRRFHCIRTVREPSAIVGHHRSLGQSMDASPRIGAAAAIPTRRRAPLTTVSPPLSSPDARAAAAGSGRSGRRSARP